MKHKKLPIRILIAAIGLMISGIGVGIFIFSQLGVDPKKCFSTGSRQTTWDPLWRCIRFDESGYSNHRFHH